LPSFRAECRIISSDGNLEFSVKVKVYQRRQDRKGLKVNLNNYAGMCTRCVYVAATLRSWNKIYLGFQSTFTWCPVLVNPLNFTTSQCPIDILEPGEVTCTEECLLLMKEKPKEKPKEITYIWLQKKTETTRIKLTHFYNFCIVWDLLTRDMLELTSKFNDI
jgi:hypothetical protein